MNDYYLRPRKSDDRFELVVYGIFPDATIHVYFQTLSAVTRSAAAIANTMYWHVAELDPVIERIPIVEESET